MNVRMAAPGVMVLAITACGQTPAPGPKTAAGVDQPRLALVETQTHAPWAHYRVVNKARTVDVFAAHDEHRKPVIVMFQGSACYPLFVIHDDGRVADTSIFQDSISPRLDRYHFVHVEKQGVAPLRFQPGMSHEEKTAAFEQTARQCSDTYVQNASKDVRVEDGLAAIEALAKESWAREILLVGHSEGSQVVTGIVRQLSTSGVSAAGLMSSAGPTQFYGFYLSRAGNRQAFAEVFDRMRMLRSADDDSMYLELPARRWKTYALNSTPLEDVRDSVLPLYVAHGERETNVLAADLFALEALRQQPDRPLRYVVVTDGDHAFVTSGGRNQFDRVFEDYLRWALDPGRRTGVTEMN